MVLAGGSGEADKWVPSFPGGDRFPWSLFLFFSVYSGHGRRPPTWGGQGPWRGWLPQCPASSRLWPGWLCPGARAQAAPWPGGSNSGRQVTPAVILPPCLGRGHSLSLAGSPETWPHCQGPEASGPGLAGKGLGSLGPPQQLSSFTRLCITATKRPGEETVGEKWPWSRFQRFSL